MTVPYAVPAEASPMMRTQIYLTKSEYHFLQTEARKRKEPMAAVIRSLVDEKMALPDDVWTNNPMLRPTPVEPGWNPPEDAAINHDHYLYGSSKKWIKVKRQWVAAPPLPDDYFDNDASYEDYNRKVRALEKAR